MVEHIQVRKEEKNKMVSVPFLCGDGTGEIMIEVKYIAGGVALDENSMCAFCHGDVCGENDEDTPITRYMKQNKFAEYCPCCEGRH